jgi:hypothetical protein
MISPISGGRREAPLSVPQPSAPKVQEVNPGAIQMAGGSEGTDLPSVDVSDGPPTSRIEYTMHGHSRVGSAAGKGALYPAQVYSLGVQSGPNRSGQIRVSTPEHLSKGNNVSAKV